MVLKAVVLVAISSSTMISVFLGLAIWQNGHLHRNSTSQFTSHLPIHFRVTRVGRGASAPITVETSVLASGATHKPAVFTRPSFPLSLLFFFLYSFWLLF